MLVLNYPDLGRLQAVLVEIVFVIVESLQNISLAIGAGVLRRGSTPKSSNLTAESSGGNLTNIGQDIALEI